MSKKRKTKKKQTKPETILTGITGPTPDNKPDLKSIDIRSELWFVKDISECVALLLTELPYWCENETKYPDDAAMVEKSVYYYLTVLSAKFKTILPPLPHGLNLIMSWVLFVYIYLLVPIKQRQTWQEVEVNAEAYVKKHGYSGFGRLQANMGCGKRTLTKALRHSAYLAEIKSLYDTIPHKPRAVTKADDLGIVRHPRPSVPLSHEEIEKILDRLHENIKQKEGVAVANTIIENIKKKGTSENMALDFKEYERKVYVENKNRKAKGLPALSILDNWQDIPEI